MSNWILLILRLIHVMGAIFWGGATLFLVLFLTPAVRAAGPPGGSVMVRLVKSTKWPTAIASAGGLTVLSGIILYWVRWLPIQSTPPAMGFLVGGISGLLALIIGGAVVGRTSAKVADLGEAIATSGGPPTPAQGAEMAALQARLTQGSNATAILLVIAMIMMSIARYLGG